MSPIETITLIGGWEGVERAAFLPVLSEFTATTAIAVDYHQARAEDLKPILPLEFAAGTTTGDVIFMTPSDAKQYYQDGHAVDVTDLIEGDKFPEFFTDRVTIGDTFFAGIYTGKVKPGFWYRPSVFEAKGWTDRVPPATVDDFEALLADIKAEGSFEAPIASGDGVGWPLSDVTEAFIIGMGGIELQNQLIDSEIRWTDSAVTTVFEKLASFIEAGYFSEPAEWVLQKDKLWAGDYAMYFMGSWIAQMVDDPDDLNFFPFPGTNGAIGAPDFLFIPTYTDHMDEAEQLFQFLVSPEGQTIQAQSPGIIAFHSDIDPSIFTSATDQRLIAFVTTIDYVSDLDDSWGGAYQDAFWDQLKLLWVSPGSIDDVLAAWNEAQDEHVGG